jgi:hypothetical protein
MDPDCDDHAFVIRLYPGEGHRLRGRITHASSGRSQPLRQPEDVLAFLAPYLASLDVRLRPKSRLVLWLSRLDPPRRRPPPPRQDAPHG